MSVRHQNRVRFYRDMTQSIVDARGVRLNARTRCYAQKIYAREVRIDKQSVTFELELITVGAQIRHVNTVARTRGRVANNEVRVRSKFGT